jgi:hypothetical protein
MAENKDFPTKKQIEAYDGLRRNHQSYVLFYWLIGIFSVILGMVFYGWIMNLNLTPIYGLLAVDGVIGWSIKHIVAYIYKHPDTLSLPLEPSQRQLPKE